MIQLTKYNSLRARLDSQYGKIRWSEWLELEKARIENNPDRTAVIHTRGRKKALWANNIVHYDIPPNFVEFEDLI